MAFKGQKKVRINLNRSLCTDEANPNIHGFDDQGTNHQTNTGLVRRAGIIPLSVTADTLGPFTGNTFFMADNGDTIRSFVSGASNNIYNQQNLLGTVSAYGVNRTNSFANTNDAINTSAGTVLTCTLSGSSVIVDEYNTSGILLRTRTIPFTILANLTGSFTSLNFIRTNTPTYSQSQEFILRVQTNAFLLRESNPTVAILRYSNLTDFYITQSVLYKSAGDSFVVFGTNDGKILSVDRFGNYRYPDGSSFGLGPYNNGTVVGARNIRAMTTFNKTLVIVGDTARIGSFDGSLFRNYDGSGFGTGIFDNSTVLGQNQVGNRYVNAAAVYGDTGSWIVFSGDSGATGSYSLTDGWHPSSSKGLGPWLGDSTQFFKIAVTRGTHLVTANINTRTITYFKTGTGHRYLMFGADSGICFSYSDTWIGHPIWVGVTAVNHGTTAPSFSRADAVITRTIRSATTYNNFFVTGSDSGLIASYADTSGWHKYDGTGAGLGPVSNQTAIGTYNVTYLNSSSPYLIAQGAGRMGTWNGSVWVAYNGASTDGLYNNATVLGTNTISASVFYKYVGATKGDSFYVVGGTNGTIGAFDISTGFWKNYNGTSNGTTTSFVPFNSGAAVNNQTILKLLVNGNKLIAVTANYVASWDGVAWKNFDSTGTGTGPANNNTALGGQTIQDACVFGTSLILTTVSVSYGAPAPNYPVTMKTYVSSIDNSNLLKKYDGTGTGAGPFTLWTGGYNSSGNVTVNQSVACGVFGSILYIGDMLITNFASNSQELISYDGSNWKFPDATGTGTGQYGKHYSDALLDEIRTGAFATTDLYISASNNNAFISKIITFNGTMVIVSVVNAGGTYTGFSSWDGSAWHYFNGTGTGSGIGTTIDATYYGVASGNNSVSVVDYNPAGTHYLVIASNYISGKLASWDGSNWKKYDGTGSGTGPFNNGSVIAGTSPTSLATLSVGAVNYLMVTGGSYVANWNGTIWTNFNSSGSGTSNNPHMWDKRDAIFKVPVSGLCFGRVTQVRVWGNKWIFAGNLNGIFSYDSSTAQWEQVYNNKNIPPTFFGDTLSAPPMIVQYKSFFVYILGNKVNSFDGSNWRYSDSTGIGTGPYSSKVLATKNINTAQAYNGWLVVGGDSGLVGSYDGTNWRCNDGNGGSTITGVLGTAGIGPSAAGGTFINFGKIWSSAIYNNALVFGASGGLIASFVGNVATVYNATGTGSTILAGNGTIPITNANIYTMTNYSYGVNNYLVIAGGTIGGTGPYLASWNGTSWTAYNGTGTQSYALALQATAMSNYPIRSITQHGNYLVCGDTHGNVFSFDPYPSTSATSNLSTWVNTTGNAVNAGSASLAPYGDSVILIAKDAATQLVSAGGYLYLLGNTGKIASWDGIANGSVNSGIWNNYLGSSYSGGNGKISPPTTQGTGSFNNGLIQTGGSIAAGFFVFNSNYLMTGPVSPFTLLNDQILFPHSSSTQIVDLPQLRSAQVFAYKFENGAYLYGITNCLESIWYSLNNNEIDVINARYAVIQFNGNSRALISGIPFFSGNLNSFGTYGYTDFVNFSNFVSYPALAIPSPVIYQSTAALGAVDVVLSKGGDTSNYYNLYAPQFNSTQSSLINLNHSNTNTTINAYGKLSNAFGLAPAYPFEFRSLLINGSQQALSVAQTGTSTDYLGVLITNVGEFDQNFIPHVYGDNTILYKYNGSFYVVKIMASAPNMIQKIGENIYKINTISPLNIVDVSNDNLNIGSCDYNGRVLFTSSIQPAVTAQFFASVFQGPYSSSIDPGNKLIYISNLQISNLNFIGYRIPSTILNFEIDSYYNNLYFASAYNDGSVLQNANLFVTVSGITQGASYSTASVVGQNGGTVAVVPVAQGYVYGQKIVTTPIETIFLLQNYNSGLINGLTLVYEGYGIGNQIPGTYASFLIQGQTYLYDGEFIWFATFSNNVLTNKNKVAEAYNLKFISQSPAIAYFISPFDNSLFAYTQDYQLQPIMQFNELPQITSGVFGDGEDTLLLLNSTSFVWMRDGNNNARGVVTENALLAQQQNLQLFNTTNGIIILGNDGVAWYSWQYHFNPVSGSAIVPLDWESGVFGQQGNQKSIVNAITVNLHNPAKTKTSINAIIKTINTGNTGNWNEYTQPVITMTVNPSDWSLNGQRLIRFQPDEKSQRSLGISVELQCNSYVIIKSVEFEVSDDTIAIPEVGFTR